MARIPMSTPYLDEDEAKNVSEAVKTGWISSSGHFLNDFSEGFARYVGTKHSINVCNGTAALHIALAALGLKKGDRVLVPTLTNVSCANSIAYTGAKPVFIDSNKQYWCIDPTKMEKKIDDKTKAIMVVHLYGHPCDMDPIIEAANKHGIPVIEDCAEAHGAEYKGRKVGTFGKISCFSFYGNKIITTGEGGACLTNDDELANRMRMLSDQRFQATKPEYLKKYYFDVLGYSYRMTNMQAAIGVAQLKKIDYLVERRRWIAKTYNELFKGIKQIKTAPEMEWAKNTYWYYSILIPKESRNKVMQTLSEKGIEARPFFYPLHMLPIYPSKRRLKIAEDLSLRGLNLPSGPQLTEENLSEVANSIIEVVGAERSD